MNQRSDGVYLETMDISPAVTDASADYLTHLDRKISDSTSGVSESIMQELIKQHSQFLIQ